MMTVGELIAKLQEAPTDMPVEVQAQGSDDEFIEGCVVDSASVYDNEVFLIEAST